MGPSLELRMHGCGRCGGLWLDNAACHKLLAGDLEDDTASMIQSAGRRPVERRPEGYRAPAAPTEAACPVCAEVLTPYVTSATKHGVRVALDVCAHHGTWFDRGEAWALYQGMALKHAELAFSIDMDRRDLQWTERNDAWRSFVGSTLRRRTF